MVNFNISEQRSTDCQEKLHSQTQTASSSVSVVNDYENPATQNQGNTTLVSVSNGHSRSLLVEHLSQTIENLEEDLSRNCQEVIILFTSSQFIFLYSKSLFNETIH